MWIESVVRESKGSAQAAKVGRNFRKPMRGRQQRYNYLVRVIRQASVDDISLLGGRQQAGLVGGAEPDG